MLDVEIENLLVEEEHNRDYKDVRDAPLVPEATVLLEVIEVQRHLQLLALAVDVIESLFSECA